MKLGVYYYPEHWPVEQWQRDFDHIAAMGLRIVHMAEFAWFALEPKPGEYQFDWLDEAMELARATVMRPPLPVVLRPAWEAVNFLSAGFLPAKLRDGYGFTWTPAHRALLAGSAQSIRRAVVPLLPDLARALPAARRAERVALAA